jgi:adenine-specific DNA-methyltransferase
VGAGVFPFPKNVEVLEDFISLICDEDDIVLDFFAGSASTGHAVYNQVQKGRKLSFILVQLPEQCEEGSAAAAAGYRTIADIGRARLRGAQAKIVAAIGAGAPSHTFGFRQFSLDASCFTEWSPEGVGEDDQLLLHRMEAHAANLRPEVAEDDILFELLLKDGFQPTIGLQRKTLGGVELVTISDGAFVICLSKNLTQEAIDAIAMLEPSRVLCLDVGFQGNDQLKANAVQTFKARARSRETAIEFRTV